MGINCRILLLNNTKNVYKAGDSVAGTVKYVIDKPTDFTSVTLSVRGKGFWNWAPIASKTIYTDSENLVDQLIDLLEAKDVKTVSIPAGTYEKQFCFVLPAEIPSSFKDAFCFISFFVQLEFVKPNSMSLPKKFYSDINTLSGIKPGAGAFLVNNKKEFTLSKKTITLITFIEKPFLYAGEDIEVIFEIIKNYSDVPLISSKIELIQCVTFQSNITMRYSLILKAIEVKYLGTNKSKTELKHTYRLSTTPNMVTVHSHELRVEYSVRIILKLPFPHLDISTTLSVAIAEKIDNFEEEKKVIEQPSNGQDIMHEKREQPKRKMIEEENEDLSDE